MSSNASTLARPYARAAFALANEHGRLRPWSSLLGFAATVASDARVAALLENPGIENDTLVGLLLPEGEIDPNFQRFLAVLAENHRLPLLPELLAQYEQLRAEVERVLRVKVTSATNMATTERENLAQALRRRFGREVEMNHLVDPELLGGAVIDTGEVVIDGSLRSKLDRLQSTLAQ